MSKKKSFIERNWGYLLLAVAVLFWALRDIGPVTTMAAFGLSGLWTLFAAPVWCGAETRDGTSCRRNSYGLLGGCSYRQHRWQRFKNFSGAKQLSLLFEGWFSNAANRIATCALVVSGIGVLGTLAQVAMAFALA